MKATIIRHQNPNEANNYFYRWTIETYGYTIVSNHLFTRKSNAKRSLLNFVNRYLLVRPLSEIGFRISHNIDILL